VGPVGPVSKTLTYEDPFQTILTVVPPNKVIGLVKDNVPLTVIESVVVVELLNSQKVPEFDEVKEGNVIVLNPVDVM
jgi:hypothetical protein